MATITQTTKLEGVLTDVTSVTLSNAAGNIGIKRNDTGATVVAAGTSFTNTTTGTYVYSFTAPATHTFYTAYIKIVASGSTMYNTVKFYVSVDTAAALVPSEIIAQYMISTASLFTTPSASGSWPLYLSSLPDGINIDDDVAAIYDTSAYLQGKHMGGSLDQRYGIQFMFRSVNHKTGYEKAKTIIDAVQNIHNVDEVLGGNTFRIENISASSGVLSLGVEEGTKQRYLFSLNLLATIKGL